MDADSLSDIQRFKSKWHFSSATDAMLATAASLVPENPKGRYVYVRATDQPSWREIYYPKNGCGEPTLLNEKLLVVAGCRTVALVTIGGETLLLDRPFDRGESVRWRAEPSVLGTLDGERFGVFVDKERQMLFDTFTYTVHSRFLVYDTMHGTKIYNLDLGRPVANVQISSAQPSSGRRRARRLTTRWIHSEADLSPGGSLVARMRDGILEVFRLPDVPVNEKAKQEPANRGH